MSKLPTTIRGWLLTIVLIVPATLLVTHVQLLLLKPLFWAAVAFVVLACIPVYLWRLRLNNAREAAWVGEFSFADSVRRVRGQEARRLADDVARRAALLNRSLQDTPVIEG